MRAVPVRLRQAPVGVVIAIATLVLAAAVAVEWKPLVRHAKKMTLALGGADPLLLALAIAAAAGAVLATAGAWVVAARELGSRAGPLEGVARYATACLAPPKCGNPARIGLLAHTLPGRRALWAMTGVCGGVSVARMLPLSLVVLAAAATGALPLWLGLAIGTLTLAVLAGALVACRHARGERLQRLLAGFALLARSRSVFVLALVWLSVATLAKLAVAAATAAAIAVPHPFRAALVLVPSLAFGRMLPFLGVAAGTFAGTATGSAGPGSALALAFAVAAAEAIGGILCGFVGATQLVRIAHLRDWRRSLTALRSMVATARAPAG
jgi:hypothetical protein